MLTVVADSALLGGAGETVSPDSSNGHALRAAAVRTRVR